MNENIGKARREIETFAFGLLQRQLDTAREGYRGNVDRMKSEIGFCIRVSREMAQLERMMYTDEHDMIIRLAENR